MSKQEISMIENIEDTSATQEKGAPHINSGHHDDHEGEVPHIHLRTVLVVIVCERPQVLRN